MCVCQKENCCVLLCNDERTQKKKKNGTEQENGSWKEIRESLVKGTKKLHKTVKRHVGRALNKTMKKTSSGKRIKHKKKKPKRVKLNFFIFIYFLTFNKSDQQKRKYKKKLYDIFGGGGWKERAKRSRRGLEGKFVIMDSIIYSPT